MRRSASCARRAGAALEPRIAGSRCASLRRFHCSACGTLTGDHGSTIPGRSQAVNRRGVLMLDLTNELRPPARPACLMIDAAAAPRPAPPPARPCARSQNSLGAGGNARGGDSTDDRPANRGKRTCSAACSSGIRPGASPWQPPWMAGRRGERRGTAPEQCRWGRQTQRTKCTCD